MSISEFNRAAGVFQKRTRIAILGPSAIAFAFFIAYDQFQERLESFLSTRFDSFTVDILTKLPIALVQIAAVVCIFWMYGRVKRQSGVRCPHCAKGLANRKKIVIASGNCPFCGKKVIEDES